MKDQNLEKLTFENGLELLNKSQKGDSVFLEKNWWYKKMLSWTMNNHDLKTRLFHFIDVLSSLSESEVVWPPYTDSLRGIRQCIRSRLFEKGV